VFEEMCTEVKRILTVEMRVFVDNRHLMTGDGYGPGCSGTGPCYKEAVVEGTLEIRDDSNSVIDINARSLLGIYRVKVFPRHFMNLFRKKPQCPALGVVGRREAMAAGGKARGGRVA
jgi:hypothetical protein